MVDVSREMQRCLNFELVSIYTDLVRGRLPVVSRFHRKMHSYTSHTNITLCIFYNSDSDPLLYPPESTWDNRQWTLLCWFCPSSPPSWGSCWPLVPLPTWKMSWVPPQCTGSRCRGLYSDPAETSTSIAEFFHLTTCLTSKTHCSS